jgi:hypothetical protein
LVRIVTIAAALVIFPSLSAETITFDRVKPGTLPPYWTMTATHAGVPAQWEVIRDPRAPTRQNVLAQVSPAATEAEYPLAIYDRAQCADGDLSVKFKITGGRHATTAGIVWRYQDQNNYYLLDFSAGENRIALYRVQDGERRPIPISGANSSSSGVKHEIHLNQWYVAKVTFQGSRVHVSFGNRWLFDAEDSGIQTQGKTGLWTMAGTMAEFDDYHVGPKVTITRAELSRFFRR